MTLTNNIAVRFIEASSLNCSNKCIHTHWQLTAFGIASIQKVSFYAINEIQVSMALTYFS